MKTKSVDCVDYLKNRVTTRHVTYFDLPVQIHKLIVTVQT